jgi:hypothetical protein
MKIYLFNPETGVFLGEDFTDDESVKTGNYWIPEDATVIAPPSIRPGEMAVFHPENMEWEVRQFPRMRIRKNGRHQTISESSRKKKVIFPAGEKSAPRGDH